MRQNLLLFTILALAAPATPAFAQQLRIGVVDMETAMYEVEEGRRARNSLEAKRDEYLTERERRQQDLTQRQEQLEAQAVMLSSEAMAAQEQELYNLAMEGQMYVYETEQQIMALNQQLFGDILEKMERVCKGVAQEEGWDLILDAAVVYSFTPEMDLTQKVITRYNATK
jgi:outer membrane protein